MARGPRIQLTCLALFSVRLGGCFYRMGLEIGGLSDFCGFGGFDFSGKWFSFVGEKEVC